PRRQRGRRAWRWSACRPWYVVPLDLRRELVEQVGVRARVDLAAEQLGGCVDGDAGHFLAQALARAGGVEIDLLLRGGDQACPRGGSGALGLVHHLIGPMLRMVDDLRGALAGLADDAL